MADTSVATGLTVQQWDDKYFQEYLGQNRFAVYMGMDEFSMIQVKDDLTKKSGDSVTFALVNALTGAGVTGSNTLEGNEEDMASRSFKVAVNKLRNGVRVSEINEQFSAISLRNAAKPALKNWHMEKTRSDIIAALGSINGVAYGSATEGQKDAWLADNSDRVLFGASTSNNSGNDHSASLLNVDSTNDKLTPGALSLMKRLALNASPSVRPIKTAKGDQEWYVAFCDSRCFRDLSENSTFTQANRDARDRGIDNPLFTGGELIWNGIIIREIPEIATLGAVGNSSAYVSPVYLCGAQALAYAIAKRPTSQTQTFDYGDKQGVAIEEIRGIKKVLFGSGTGDTDDLKDHGVVTGYFAAAAD